VVHICSDICAWNCNEGLSCVGERLEQSKALKLSLLIVSSRLPKMRFNVLYVMNEIPRSDELQIAPLFGAYRCMCEHSFFIS
jgi:hypothetical protein